MMFRKNFEVNFWIPTEVTKAELYMWLIPVNAWWKIFLTINLWLCQEYLLDNTEYAVVVSSIYMILFHGVQKLMFIIFYERIFIASYFLLIWQLNAVI